MNPNKSSPPVPQAEADPKLDKEVEAAGQRNEFTSALNAGAANTALRFLLPDGRTPVAVIPKGYKLEVVNRALVDRWRGNPQRKAGFFHFGTVESFIRYVTAHKTADTAIFVKADDAGAKFYAILNFHGAEPSFNDHVACVVLEATNEWLVWNANAGRKMSQKDFATFLEDNTDLFTSPGGLELLELVTTLEGKAHVDIVQGIKLQTGAVNLSYNETIELKGGGSGSQAGQMTIPKELKVAIAPFEGTHVANMSARLRYRIDNRKITLWYEPIKSHLHVREIVDQLKNFIHKQTGFEPLAIGKDGLNSALNNSDEACPW